MRLMLALAMLLGGRVGAETAAPSKIVGQWAFMSKGRTRIFQFNENRTFRGRLPVSGHDRDLEGGWFEHHAEERRQAG